jgi:uncharacterized protein DUF3443
VSKLSALVLIPVLLAAGCGGGGGSSTTGGNGNGNGTGNTLACTAESVSLAEQLQNPVALFTTDNNGVILELPPIASTGATDPTGGVLVFGIGTESNNGIATGVTKLDGNPDTGNVTATLNGKSYPNGYFDSGSNANFINDSALAVCPSPNQGFYCPNTASVTENATMQGTNTSPIQANFNVENAITLFEDNTSATAFNDLAGPNSDSMALDLGLPFFFGQNIYTGFESPTNATPYFGFEAVSTPGTNTQPTIATAGPPNVEPLVVDSGPSGLNPAAVNTPFVSVTVCVPNTSDCQTIDHVEVDTGSVGLRLIASVVTLALPAEKDASNNPLAECLQFADGTSWGSVVTADITMPTSSKSAKGVNVQLIGASAAGSPPTACTGTAENTVNSFGANGIIGVGPFSNDCNISGDCAPGGQSANYYYCTG